MLNHLAQFGRVEFTIESVALDLFNTDLWLFVTQRHQHFYTEGVDQFQPRVELWQSWDQDGEAER